MKSFEVDVSRSEQMEELWVVCVYMQKMELSYWWEQGDEKQE